MLIRANTVEKVAQHKPIAQSISSARNLRQQGQANVFLGVTEERAISYFHGIFSLLMQKTAVKAQ